MLETGVARRKILRPVIEPIAINLPGRYPATRFTPGVQHRHCQAVGNQGAGTDQARNTAADHGDRKRVVAGKGGYGHLRQFLR
jgi:hypothetical protein